MTVPLDRTWHVAVGAAVLGLAVALTAVAAAGPWDGGQRTAERAAAAAWDRADPSGEHPTGPGSARPARTPAVVAAAPDVLTGLDDGTGPATAPLPTAQALREALTPLLNAAGLGRVRTASVVDVVTGRTLYGSGAGTAVVPASVTKIATATAALSLLGPDARLTTRTVLAGSGRVVLVGGGDPTLTARAPAGGGYQAASLRDLASATARALRDRDATRAALTYDTSLYSGPAVHPIGTNPNLAPVTALTADEGRLDGSYQGPAPRAGDPASAAAETFADLLRDHGITVTGTPSAGRAPRRATRYPDLAAVQSPPLSSLVERMLTNSDNDIAESLARHAALAVGRPGSFAGGAATMASALRGLRVPLAGAVFTDGSGLSRDDRLSADQLSRLLALAADAAHPELRPVLTGLPVAGFSGSLSARFGSDARQVGAGVVRAKTGTLSGVDSLAGTVVDADGRLLAFAFLTNGSTSSASAQPALDRLAAAVSNCGCR
jgi:D-alanyl-D-alanine carboxypeptidase/D-alanyl-D-alanine-endopeptidase (penicillin-binding protein 4)